MNIGIVFEVWHEGDRSVGIDGESAEVSFPYAQRDDADFIRAAREILRDAFTKLWDFPAHVATREELAATEED